MARQRRGTRSRSSETGNKSEIKTRQRKGGHAPSRRARRTEDESNDRSAEAAGQYTLDEEEAVNFLEINHELDHILDERERDEEALKRERQELLLKMESAADAVQKAMDGVRVAWKQADHKAFDEKCEAYARSAKGFAKLILEERIRQSFEGKIDPATGRSIERRDEKKKHGEDIRNWLFPWNFAFEEKKTGLRHQVYGRDNKTTSGAFTMIVHGGTRTNRECGDWDRVKEILLNPSLVDVTEEVRTRQRE